MKIGEFIKDIFLKRVREKKCLVIYDPEKRYKDIVFSLKNSQNMVIDASDSIIISREDALTEWLLIKEKKYLLIYLPFKKPVKESDRQKNPFEIFAIGGAVFPDGDGDMYKSLCCDAYPDHIEQIEELFQTCIPTLEAIDSLKGDIRWPLLKTSLKAESSKEIILTVMCPDKERLQFLNNTHTWFNEYKDLCKEILDFTPVSGNDFSSIQDELWRYILFSEFFLDIKKEIPESFRDIPVAPEELKGRIFQICDSLRQNLKYIDFYIEKAKKIEDDYKLSSITAHLIDSGTRDTFLFQSIKPVEQLAALARAGQYEELKAIMANKENSIWASRDPDVGYRWEIACTGIELLMNIEKNEEQLNKNKSSLVKIIQNFSLPAYQVDSLSRKFEYNLNKTIIDISMLNDYVQVVRNNYMSFITRQQMYFISLVKKEGWYPAGINRSLDFFSKYVKKVIDYQKTAVFMVDALRYELAYKIDDQFSKKHNVTIEAALSPLPSITQLGMAALLPGADENYKIKIEDKRLIPYINDFRILTPADRMQCLKRIYGDRCEVIDITEIPATKKLIIEKKVDLLVVKTGEIDTAGEKIPHSASSILPELLRNLIRGIEKVIQAGFERIFIAADHGFILFPFSEPGTSREITQGDWDVVGKRYLIGRGQIDKSLLRFSKDLLGIDIEADDIVFPENFATFKKGIYMHGGISLHECVIPIITIAATKTKTRKKEPVEIILTYKGKKTGKITSRRPIITIKILEEKGIFEDMLEKTEVELLIHAYKGKLEVGEPAPNKYIDSLSGLVTIKKGDEVKIPIKMKDDFEGNFEIRILNPITHERYATLELETDYLE